MDSLAERFHLIYPSKNYVENSYEGPAAASCLCLSKKVYTDKYFPKSILHKFEGSENYAFNQGIIPHLKVCIVHNKDFSIDDNTIIYYGSHNFS